MALPITHRCQRLPVTGTRCLALVTVGLLISGLAGPAAAVGHRGGCTANFFRPVRASNDSALSRSPLDDTTLSEVTEGTTRLIGPLLCEEAGVVVEPVYVGEVFSNTRGGITTRDATQYEALLDLAVTVDLQQIGTSIPGTFFLLAQQTHGRGLTEDFVGDIQTISNIDSGDNIMQVSEYWWELPLLSGDLTVRLGKQDVNTEFVVLHLAGDFLQSSFGISPTVAIPTYPHPSAAAVVLAKLTDGLTMKVGVWDGVSDGGNWGFSGTGITFTICELDYEYALLDGRLPGAFHVGMAYTSAGEIAGVPSPQTYGYYIHLDQIVCREDFSDPHDEQGLGILLQYASGYERGNVLFREHLGAGVVYRGLVPGRDEDTVGLGVANAWLSSGSGFESALELFYKAQVRPWMTLQPDIQYVTSPSGLYPDALAVGLRFELVL